MKMKLLVTWSKWMWKNNYNSNDTWLIKTIKWQVLINGMDIENHRISLLHKMNFISPYIELPKKLNC